LFDEQFIRYFIHGLKEEIRGCVRSLITFGPILRHRLMNLAKAVENEAEGRSTYGISRKLNYNVGNPNRGNFHKPNNSPYNGRSSGNDGLYIKYRKDRWDHRWNFSGNKTQKPGDQREQGNREKGFRHLTSQEIVDWRKKGLCFKCGGAFHLRHQCPYVGVGMVQFGIKTEPNWTELFAKFKITELNCLHFEPNWTVSNRTELNCFY